MAKIIKCTICGIKFEKSKEAFIHVKECHPEIYKETVEDVLKKLRYGS